MAGKRGAPFGNKNALGHRVGAIAKGGAKGAWKGGTMGAAAGTAAGAAITLDNLSRGQGSEIGSSLVTGAKIGAGVGTLVGAGKAYRGTKGTKRKK